VLITLTKHTKSFIKQTYPQKYEAVIGDLRNEKPECSVMLDALKLYRFYVWFLESEKRISAEVETISFDEDELKEGLFQGCIRIKQRAGYLERAQRMKNAIDIGLALLESEDKEGIKHARLIKIAHISSLPYSAGDSTYKYRHCDCYKAALIGLWEKIGAACLKICEETEVSYCDEIVEERLRVLLTNNCQARRRTALKKRMVMEDSVILAVLDSHGKDGLKADSIVSVAIECIEDYPLCSNLNKGVYHQILYNRYNASPTETQPAYIAALTQKHSDAVNEDSSLSREALSLLAHLLYASC